MKISVELEFNENDLGPKWMNLDNLEILLYTEASTRRDLLKVISFEEESPNTKLQNVCDCGGKDVINYGNFDQCADCFLPKR